MTPFYHGRIPNTAGIYRITCTVTGKIYIGSTVNLRQRWMDHRKRLRGNGHDNQKLQRAWSKYGEVTFVFEIIELVLIPELLTTQEQYWIDKLKPFFNIAKVAGSNLGSKRSAEAKHNMSQAQKNRLPDGAETREKKSIANIGRPVSAETRAQLSISNTAASLGRRKTLIVTSPDGVKYAVVGIHEFCREHHLDRSTLMRVAKGKYSHHKGWKAHF